MRQKLLRYMITPVFNENARNEIREQQPDIPHAEYRKKIAAGEQKIFDSARPLIINIINQHGGNIEYDGTGWGIEGHPRRFSGIVAEFPDEALAEMNAIPDIRVNRFEKSTFDLPKTF